MAEKKNKYESGFGSDALKDPQRIVFVTKKTSAKVKGDVGGQLMSYPHLVLREAIAFMVLMIVLVSISLVWDAPLEQLANPLLTPNPAKAPWYFLGLQELLHYFPPLVAGIIIPTLAVIALVVIPYFNVNIRGEPLWAANRPRRFRIVLATLVVLLVFLAVFRAWTPRRAAAPMRSGKIARARREGASSSTWRSFPRGCARRIPIRSWCSPAARGRAPSRFPPRSCRFSCA